MTSRLHKKAVSRCLLSYGRLHGRRQLRSSALPSSGSVASWLSGAVRILQREVAELLDLKVQVLAVHTPSRISLCLDELVPVSQIFDDAVCLASCLPWNPSATPFTPSGQVVSAKERSSSSSTLELVGNELAVSGVGTVAALGSLGSAELAWSTNKVLGGAETLHEPAELGVVQAEIREFGCMELLEGVGLAGSGTSPEVTSPVGATNKVGAFDYVSGIGFVGSGTTGAGGAHWAGFAAVAGAGHDPEARVAADVSGSRMDSLHQVADEHVLELLHQVADANVLNKPYQVEVSDCEFVDGLGYPGISCAVELGAGEQPTAPGAGEQPTAPFGAGEQPTAPFGAEGDLIDQVQVEQPMPSFGSAVQSSGSSHSNSLEQALIRRGQRWRAKQTGTVVVEDCDELEGDDDDDDDDEVTGQLWALLRRKTARALDKLENIGSRSLGLLLKHVVVAVLGLRADAATNPGGLRLLPELVAARMLDSWSRHMLWKLLPIDYQGLVQVMAEDVIEALDNLSDPA